MLDLYTRLYGSISVIYMTDEAYIDKLTPGELFSYLSDRKSLIDLDIPLEEQDPGQLIVLELNGDEFKRYKRDLYRKLIENAKQNALVEGIIRELYGVNN